MRYYLSILIVFVACQNLSSQVIREGRISYVTSQHVYVKFSSMDDVSVGDTIYFKQNGRELPALEIENLSSISCVCTPLLDMVFKVSDVVFVIPAAKDISEPVSEPLSGDQDMVIEITPEDSAKNEPAEKNIFKQDIGGRLSISSYSDFANNESDGNQKMKYSFSAHANHIGNTGFSAESYITFSHSKNDWDAVKNDIFNGLKIYNLSVKYDFGESMHALVGRRINPKLSSVGAIDGLQFENKFSSFTLGAIAGSRPDYKNYSINIDLLQYGFYAGHDIRGRNGTMQSTLALIEQTNRSMTDRRFIYFQHTNMLLKNLYFFASAEFDLYKKVNDTKLNVFDLSNTYISLRYRIIRPLSIGVSYSARNNLIYYESYKDFLERLLDSETLQGWRINANYHPARYIFIGVNAGYRFRKEDPLPSRNLHGYVTWSNVPGLGVSMTASSTWIETSYLKGPVYGLGMSRDLIPGKLSGGIKYRYVDYLYNNAEKDLIQHVGEANLSLKVFRKLSLSIYYEGTFEKDLPYNRLYINLSQRF